MDWESVARREPFQSWEEVNLAGAGMVLEESRIRGGILGHPFLRTVIEKVTGIPLDGKVHRTWLIPTNFFRKSLIIGV